MNVSNLHKLYQAGSRVDNPGYYKIIQIPGTDTYIHGATYPILVYDCRFQVK